MSFRCGGCHHQTEGRPIRKVIKRRSHRHPERPEARPVGDGSGVGAQIVKELNLCEACARTVEFYESAPHAALRESLALATGRVSYNGIESLPPRTISGAAFQ